MRQWLLLAPWLGIAACVTVQSAPPQFARLRIRISEQVEEIGAQQQTSRSADMRATLEQALQQAGYQVAKGEGQPADLLALLGYDARVTPTRITARFENGGRIIEELSGQGGWKMVLPRLVNAMPASRRLADFIARPAAPAAAATAVPTRPDAANRVLAVLEFRSKLRDADRAALDAGYFADLARSAALRTVPTLQVVTRENLLVLLEASGKKLEECEGECEIDTGRRVGADLVMSGELLKIGSLYKLTLRLHETRAGKLLAGSTGQGMSPEELDADATRALQELLSPLR